MNLARFQHPNAGDNNRFSDYGAGDPDVDANDDEERCETCGKEIGKCECGEDEE